MMRCETCCHECSVVDFVSLRNLCEHLYLDSLAKKQGSSWSRSGRHSHSGIPTQRVGSLEGIPRESVGELSSLEK